MFGCVQLDRYEEQDREGDQRRAAIAEKRQRNADYRHDTNRHADIDRYVEQKDRRHAVAIDPAEGFHLTLAHPDDPQDQDGEQDDDDGAAQESPLFADRAEDEVGTLFGGEIEFRLRPFEKAFAAETARSDRDFRLVYVVAPAFQVGFQAQQIEDSLLLVYL